MLLRLTCSLLRAPPGVPDVPVRDLNPLPRVSGASDVRGRPPFPQLRADPWLCALASITRRTKFPLSTLKRLGFGAKSAANGGAAGTPVRRKRKVGGTPLPGAGGTPAPEAGTPGTPVPVVGA